MNSTPNRAQRRTSDDIVRTVIFLFGTGMAIYFLLGYNNFINVIAAFVFMIIGGNNMRHAWFPYGRVVESAFWVILSSFGFVAALLFRAFGDKDAGTISVMMGCLVLYSLWDTYRSVRAARRALEAIERNREHPDQQA